MAAFHRDLEVREMEVRSIHSPVGEIVYVLTLVKVGGFFDLRVWNETLKRWVTFDGYESFRTASKARAFAEWGMLAGAHR